MAAATSRAKSVKKSPANQLPKPWRFQSAWYIKRNTKRVYLFPMTDDQKAEYKAGKESVLTLEQNAEFLRQMALAEAVAPDNPNRAEMRVDTLAQLYLDDRKGHISEEKYSQYKRSLQSFCEFCGANSLTDITPALVRRWVAKQKTWKSSSTRRSNVKVILQLFNFAVEDQILPASPLVKLGKKLGKEQPEAKRDFLIYSEDVKNLIAKSKPDFRPVITFLVETGRRPDEVSNIRKSEIARTESGLMISMKHHKNFAVTQEPEKLYLSEALTQIVNEALADTSNKTPWLFVTSRGTPWNTARIGKRWEAACKRAGISEDCTTYAARHSFITKSLVAGVALPVVAYLVGNSISVLVKQYAHVCKQHSDVFFDAIRKATAPNPNYRPGAVPTAKPVEPEAEAA